MQRSQHGIRPAAEFRRRLGARAGLAVAGGRGGAGCPAGAGRGRLAVQCDLQPSLSLTAGYRILEGGADNDEVYTFSLFHYLVAGAAVRF